MPISDHMVKPMKKGEPNWRGTPQMKELTDTEGWEEAKKLADDLDNMSAVDLLLFHHDWYERIGYSNLGKLFISMINAYAVERSQQKEPA